jgi:N-carbamoylputrescine amidase
MNDRKPRDEAIVKIACIQMEPVVGEKQRNVRRSLEFIERAATNGAQLVVLPELCNSGYYSAHARRLSALPKRSRPGQPASAGRRLRVSTASISSPESTSATGKPSTMPR